MQQNKGKDTNEYRALTIDIDYYQSLLDDVDIPEEKKREFVEILVAIGVQFVQWGYGIHPLQAIDAIDQEQADFCLFSLIDEQNLESESPNSLGKARETLNDA